MAMKIIYKNDGTVPIDDILCTTYQMRNFYHQLRDGYFSDLDIMNYMQHLSAVRMVKKGDILLDVCCGRGLLLPLLRYHAKYLKKYIGVDIKLSNIEANKKHICNGKSINPQTFYPFQTQWIVSNVSNMSEHVLQLTDKVDICVYTSSIEHMQKEAGEASLFECHKVMKSGATLFLSCPNTPEERSGYDVQYKAHVYEWKLSELRKALNNVGFCIYKEIGLTGNIKDLKKRMKLAPIALQEYFDSVLNYIPLEFAKPLLFIKFPDIAKEVLILAKRGS